MFRHWPKLLLIILVEDYWLVVVLENPIKVICVNVLSFWVFRLNKLTIALEKVDYHPGELTETRLLRRFSLLVLQHRLFVNVLFTLLHSDIG